MAGRNNKPDNDGPASSPSRLDQFGDKPGEEKARKRKNAGPAAGRDRC